MRNRMVTLTTDFGEGSHYVAAMKGAVYSVNPAAQIVDLTHSVAPQDLQATALFLSEVVPYYPPTTVHVVVVDPGVGTERLILCVEAVSGVFLAPDNGCWTEAVRPGDVRRVVRLADSTYWRSPVSSTFHGRDIFATAAGHLSLGTDPARLGPTVTDWKLARLPVASWDGTVIHGSIVAVDRFGNLISNVRQPVPHAGSGIKVAGKPVPQLVKTYGEAEPGTLVALIGSSGRLEFAVVNGSAAVLLGVGVGAAVEVAANV